MPRCVRQPAPGALHHIISRFFNRNFLLTGRAERAEYLRRAAAAWSRTDCRILGYALMSSHVHWALVTGEAPWASFLQPLHTGFAQWLNRREDRLGPVFAGRPTVVLLDAARALALLTYIHNNPVRAGVARRPEQSYWTSHRAYIGDAPAPAWLDVEHGLALAGCDGSRAARRRFQDLVTKRSHEARCDALDELALGRLRRDARARLGPGVELAGAREGVGGALSHDVVAKPGALLRERWLGPPSLVVDVAARHLGMPATRMRSSERSRDVVAARRVVLVAGVRYLNRGVYEMASTLGISGQAAGQLLRPRDGLTPALVAVAARVAAECGRADEL